MDISGARASRWVNRYPHFGHAGRILARWPGHTVHLDVGAAVAGAAIAIAVTGVRAPIHNRRQPTPREEAS
jgi:hypothetical protein